ncbi:uncharacterized protein LOC134679122 [Cydia fagiglandana]|uniref:uncharacterized protein LOC134679122 n=1 Tax=Cydia fagiglandana TaxID=1458189 RepID=UPI002FEE2E8D
MILEIGQALSVDTPYKSFLKSAVTIKADICLPSTKGAVKQNSLRKFHKISCGWEMTCPLRCMGGRLRTTAWFQCIGIDGEEIENEDGDEGPSLLTPSEQQLNSMEIIGLLNNNTKVLNRVVAATGVGKNTVTLIKKEGNVARANSCKLSTPKKGKRGPKFILDNFDKCALRNIITNMYRQKIVPTVQKILTQAQLDINFLGQRTTLLNIMKNHLGFRFKRCTQKRLELVEQPQIKAWRARYLTRIRENDALGPNKKLVVYLDETWIHCHYTVNKCWQSMSEQGIRKYDSAGNRWIIIHAGSENGFVNGALAIWKANSKKGDYHGQVNTEKFIKWITNNLLPNIPPNSIIVMDNASYHSTQVNKPPISRDRKDVMKEWLKAHNIEFSMKDTVSILYEIINKNRPPKEHLIDNPHGHEVLRLPPYHCDLNPIEYIWHLVKQRVSQKNVLQRENEIEAITLESLASITENDWKKEVTHVKHIENDYWLRENMEIPRNEVIVNTGDDTESSDDDSVMTE